jgi:hypothetical protein
VSRRIADLIVPDPDDDEQALRAVLRPRDLILGVDGRIHYGNVVRKFGVTLMDGVICGQLAMRAIGPRERWWTRDEHRGCAECGNPTGPPTTGAKP